MSAKYHSPIHPYPVVKWIPKADGKGLTDRVTARHATKYALLPSVTTQLDFGDEGLLEHIKQRLLFFSAVRPYHGGFDASHDPDPEALKEWQDEIYGLTGEELKGFADQGVELHAQVAQYYEGKIPYPTHEGAAQIVETLAPVLKQCGVTKVVCERVLGSPEIGFVGTPDLVGVDDDDNVKWIGDMKQVNPSPFAKFKTDRSLYPKWRLQLAAYAILLKTSDAVVHQVLSNRESNECKLILHDRHESAIEAARHHFIGFQWRKFDGLIAHRWKEVKDDPKIMGEIRNIHEINNGGEV